MIYRRSDVYPDLILIGIEKIEYEGDSKYLLLNIGLDSQCNEKTIIKTEDFEINDDESINFRIPYGIREISSVKSFTKIKKIIVPNTVSHIGYQAFLGMGIEEVVFDDINYEDTESTFIKDFFLKHMSQDYKFQIAEDLRLSAGCFQNNNIKEINLPPRCKKIGFDVFKNNLIETVKLDNVCEIYPFAFMNNRIKKLEIHGCSKMLFPFSFCNNPIEYIDCQSGTIIYKYAFGDDDLTDKMSDVKNVTFNEIDLDFVDLTDLELTDEDKKKVLYKLCFKFCRGGSDFYKNGGIDVTAMYMTTNMCVLEVRKALIEYLLTDKLPDKKYYEDITLEYICKRCFCDEIKAFRYLDSILTDKDFAESFKYMNFRRK